MAAAWKRVKANKGSAGVDGLTIDEAPEFLKTHWPRIRAELLSGTYRPQAVRRVEIPKPAGGRWWSHSGSGLNLVLTVKYFDDLGIPRLI
jgi:retron-type reverse transcriptase